MQLKRSKRERERNRFEVFIKVARPLWPLATNLGGILGQKIVKVFEAKLLSNFYIIIVVNFYDPLLDKENLLDSVAERERDAYIK